MCPLVEDCVGKLCVRWWKIVTVSLCPLVEDCVGKLCVRWWKIVTVSCVSVGGRL